ncbi:MAG: chemotaxis protein CheW [Pirellulales bacterium]
MQSGTSLVPDARGEVQLATFPLGDLWLGIDIRRVHEINRNLQVTRVPHAPRAVRGVINLRGEVVTVLELGPLLGVKSAVPSSVQRNVIVTWAGEQVGLVVDGIADVLSVAVDDIATVPEHLAGREANCFHGVHQFDGGLITVLDVGQALELATRPALSGTH